MRKRVGYLEKGKQFFYVLLPIFVTQLSLTATGFFDTVMAGRLSEADLAGVAVGTNLFMPFFGSFLGIISGLTPVLSQLYGAKKQEKIGGIVKQGFYWAFFLALLLWAFELLVIPCVLSSLALEPRVEEIAHGFLRAICCGLPFIFVAGVLRNFIDAHGMTRLTMCITILIVPINIAFNFIFMYGAFGIPSFGGMGAGIGTALAFALNLGFNAIAVTHIEPFRSYRVFHHLPHLDFAEWRKQLGLGIPIGATFFCEQSIFSAVALFMTVYGTAIVAAHQSAMNFTTLIYMIPMSASMALAILVGYETGARRAKDAEEYIRLGRVLTFVVEGSLALLFWQFHDAVASLYTTSEELHPILVSFLFYAVFLQFADSINAPLQGALRGYKDVHVTFLLAILSYWGIGLPLGYIAANDLGMGPYGYWISLIAGVFVGAICLTLRLHRVQKKIAEFCNG